MRRLREQTLCIGLWLAATIGLGAAPKEFSLPAQSAAEALIEFARQSGVEVIYASDFVRGVTTVKVDGIYEPADALERLLRGTHLAARRNGSGKFVVTLARQPTGTLRGRLLGPEGQPVAAATVVIDGTRLSAATGDDGVFEFSSVPPGAHRLLATATGFQPLQVEKITVAANQLTEVEAQRFQAAEELSRLEPIVVRARSTRMKLLDDSASLLGQRRATGNLDLLRTESDALPFAVLTREQISRSGVVSLNDFLQRAVLEGDTSPTPEQSLNGTGPVAGSRNLNLRSYGATETVVLINGRRLPEILTSDSDVQPPDVNFIPLSLVQQVEVLPLSASALYSGSPVGGVINIVLRPDVTATEVTATYTNALDGLDAPQASLSLQHGQSLLDGRLRLRLSANLSRTEPPTEAELGHRRRHDAARVKIGEQLHRATPNIRTLDGSALLAGSTSSYTSVAPGANGTGGLATFSGRMGVRNLDFFDGPGGLALSPTSVDSPYGRRERRAAWFGSATWDPWPWLQVGLDATTSRTVINRGHGILAADLFLPAGPHNPFGQDVEVSLNEQATALGENYNETRIDFTSAVGGLLLRLPRDWQAGFDAQYSHNVVHHRGLAGADRDRWEALVATGGYNPLRDTQAHAAPARFYDEVLVYRGGRNRFVETGDYQTLDAAARLTNQNLPLPTGRGVLQAGADYRWQKLSAFNDEFVYADGAPAVAAAPRSGRTLERYSFFAELQGPLWPTEKLPRPFRALETDLAVRYVASSLSREANVAPTFGLKASFAGGVAFRGSVTTSNRFPTPQLSKPVLLPGGGPDIGLNREVAFDPVRNETYEVRAEELLNPALSAEEAVTQTAGLLFEHGDRHRLRASLDYVDTRKTNELLALDSQAIINSEAIFPGRVVREAARPGDPGGVGRISLVLPGSVNASWRHSRNWNAALDYTREDFAGGTLELRGRLVWFQSYERRVFANTPVVDQLRAPDGNAPGLLRARAHFGASWAGRRWGFGADGQYFHARVLPRLERPGQGDKQIKPWWQFDAFVRTDLGQFVPWRGPRTGLTAQLRVNNLFGTDFPRYAHDISAAGQRAYGDWRGRTYSLSVTAAF